MKKKLSIFADELIGTKLEPLGFVKRGNTWYKVLPDVVVCMGVRKTHGRGFDVCFGIVPFVCIPSLQLNMNCFQSDGAYYRSFKEDYISFYDRLYGIPEFASDHFKYTIDSTTDALRSPDKYIIILEYWSDVINKTMLPFMLNVRDLETAMEEIGRYNKFSGHWDPVKKELCHEEAYQYVHIPAFMKLERTAEVMRFFGSFIEGEKESCIKRGTTLEQRAEQALESGDYCSTYLWCQLLIDNKRTEMSHVVKELEKEAYSWLNDNSLF